MEQNVIELIAKTLPRRVAKNFVNAALPIIEALLISKDPESRQEIGVGSYGVNDAIIPTTAPEGGWIGASEVRNAHKEIVESLKVENFVDGVVKTLSALSALGAI